MQIFTWGQRLVVISTSLAVIAVFGGTGWLIDMYAQTKPLFMVGFIIVSFPVTQILVAKRMKKHLEKHPWNGQKKEISSHSSITE